ncbi:MAG: hypothetical protein ACLPYW_17230 [Acidimicrobiales bacterium]
MPTNMINSAADYRDARNNCMIEIDESWLLCCDAVELPRRSLEQQLASAQSAYRAQQAGAMVSYRGALEEAWATYKQEVAGAPPFLRGATAGTQARSRRDVIAEALARYESSAAAIGRSYDQLMTAARDDYAQIQKDAHSAYLEAVSQESVKVLEAISRAWTCFEPTYDASTENSDVADIARARTAPALRSEPRAEAKAEPQAEPRAEPRADLPAAGSGHTDFDAQISALITSSLEDGIPLKV